MFFNVAELMLGKVRFEQTFAPGAIEFYDPQIKQSGPLTTSGVAQMSEATSEIRISGHLNTSMIASCDRCLEPAAMAIDSDFDLLYRPAATLRGHEEQAIDAEEAEVGFYEGEGLELKDVLREQILLLLPMQRFCSPDCKGICPVCGQNRNQVACDCHQETAEGRWAGLKNL